MRIQVLDRSARIVLAAIILIGLAVPFLLNYRADAATFQSGTFVRLDHLSATTATGGRVCIKPATAPGASGKLVLNFPTTSSGTDYVVNSTAANWTTNSTFESGFSATALPITGNVASNVTGKAVTFSLSSNLTVGTLYCFNFSGTNTLTTSSAGAPVNVFGYVETQTSGSAQVDRTYWGATMITDESVVVTAIVAPVFTLTLSGNTDTFANNLSAASVNTSNGNRTITVDTNALNGWIVWVMGTNFKTVTDAGTSPANRHGALTSATAGGYAISNNTTGALVTPNASHAFSGGSEDYGLAVSINTDPGGGGTVSLNAAYNGTTAGNAGVIDPTQYRPIASSNGLDTSSDILNIKILATIATSTPPGADYTDTLRYVGAGQF